MLKPIYLRSFEKELEKAQKRGYDMEKLKEVMSDLIHQKPLATSHRNHRLKGNFSGYYECRITSDWLLIYKTDDEHVYFVRTGTHSDLF